MDLVPVTLWGSSHLTPRHFPDFCKDIIKNIPRFQDPVYHAKGGLKLSPDVVTEIQNTIFSQRNDPQVHVIILGCNNIRNYQTVEGVLHLFSRIVNFAKNIPDCILILSSLFTSPDYFCWTASAFNEMNQSLRGFAHRNSHFCFYMDFSSKLNRQTDTPFFKDAVHLSRTGAKLFASCIRRSIAKIPYNVFHQL